MAEQTSSAKSPIAEDAASQTTKGSTATPAVMFRAAMADRQLRSVLAEVKKTTASLSLMTKKAAASNSLSFLSSPVPHPLTDALRDASALPSCNPVVLQLPLPPLDQRVKAKIISDVRRRQRRAAREAAATVKTREALLSRPLSHMAARLISVATAGAPLLFPEAYSQRQPDQQGGSSSASPDSAVSSPVANFHSPALTVEQTKGRKHCDWASSSAAAGGTSATQAACRATSASSPLRQPPVAEWRLPSTLPYAAAMLSTNRATGAVLRCYAASTLQRCFSTKSTSSDDGGRESELHSSSPSLTSEWPLSSSPVSRQPSGAQLTPSVAPLHERGDSSNGRRQRQPEETANTPQNSGISRAGESLSLSQCQRCCVAEVEAIEQGQIVPYISYIFTPVARVLDLNQMASPSPSSERATAPVKRALEVSATCIAVPPHDNFYVLGSSNGIVWRVPVRGADELARATPLGTLQSQAHHSPPPLATPLHGHTAAISSIAFNDDGSIFVSSSLDGCVILWRAATGAKLRRITAAFTTSAPASSTATTAAAAPPTPCLPQKVFCMPHNNNYLLVSYAESSLLRLYNCSTGLPVTSGHCRHERDAALSLFAGHRRSGRNEDTAATAAHHRSHCGGDDAVTAIAVHSTAVPFFFAGDAGGSIALWTCRSGATTVWPSLGEASGNAAATSGAAALHQLPELRRLTVLALPPSLGSVAALQVSPLYKMQLCHLLGGGDVIEASTPTAVELESLCRKVKPLVAQNRLAREMERRGGQRSNSGSGNAMKGSGETPRTITSGSGRDGQWGRASKLNAARDAGGDAASHALTALPSKLSETLTSLWPSSWSTLSFSAKRSTDDAAALSGGASPSPVAATEEAKRHLFLDLMEVLCPLQLLVTMPCDTIFIVGVFMRLHYEADTRATAAAGAAAGMTALYELHSLFRTRVPSRLRHVGVGALQSPDNIRLVVAAIPCEEGFVRVLPLQHMQRDTDSQRQALATLPTPYGGRCTGLAWAADGRLLIAITAQGVVYEWDRIYLALAPLHDPMANSASTKPGLATSVVDDGGSVTLAASTAAAMSGIGVQPMSGLPFPPISRHRKCDLPQNQACYSLAAQAAFDENDAWRASLQCELERQRRESAAMKFRSDSSGAFSGSGYLLDEKDEEGASSDWEEFDV